MSLNSLIFHPPVINNAFTFGVEYSNTQYLDTNRGYKIPYILIEREGELERVGKEKTEIIIYCHGNATDIYTSRKLVDKIRKITGCSILVYDYCGYGAHQFKDLVTPCEDNIEKDLQSIIDHLVCKLNVPIKDIYLLGQSLGTGPSVKVASCIPNLGGLILISPYTSLCRIILGNSFPFIEELDMFDTVKNIRNVGCSIFLTHSKYDEIISFEHSLLLYEILVNVGKEGDEHKKRIYNYWETDKNSSHNNITNKMLESIANFIRYS